MDPNEDLGRENDQEADRCSSGRTEDMEISHIPSDVPDLNRQYREEADRSSGMLIKREDSTPISSSATTSSYFSHKLHPSDPRSLSKASNFHVNKIIKPDPDDAETTTSEYASEGNYLEKEDNPNNSTSRTDQKFDYFSSNFADPAFNNSKHILDGTGKTTRGSSVDSFSPSFQGKSALAKLSEMFSGKTRDLSFKSYGEKLLENQSSKGRKMENYFPFSTSFSHDDKQGEAKSLMSATSSSSVVDPDMIPIKYEGNFDGQNCVRKLESLVASMNKRTKLGTTRQSDLARMSSASSKDNLQHAYATNYQANQSKSSHNYLFPFSVEALTGGYPNDAPLDLSVKKKKRSESRVDGSPSSEQSGSLLSTSYSYKMPSLYINDHNSAGGSSLASLEKKFGENSKILDWVGTSTRTSNIFSNFSEPTVDKSSSAYSSLCGMMLNDFGISPPLLKSRQFIGSGDQFCMKHSPQMPRAMKESHFSKAHSQSVAKDKEFRLYPVLGNWPTKQKDSASSSSGGGLNATKKRCGPTVSPNSPKSSEPCRNETGFRLVRGQDAWMRSGYEQAEQILRCLECNTSFDSLPKLTVHMIQTAHYLNLARQDKYLRGSVSGDSSRPDYFVPHSASFSSSSESKSGGGDKESNTDAKKSASPKTQRGSPSRSPFSPVKFIKQEPMGRFSSYTPEDNKESTMILDKSDDNETSTNENFDKSVRIPHLKKVSSADSDTSNERSPTSDSKDHTSLAGNPSFTEENSTPPKLEPIQAPFDGYKPKHSSPGVSNAVQRQNESSSALKAMQSFINRSFSGKSAGVHSFLAKNSLGSNADKFPAGGYVQPSPKVSTLQDDQSSRRLVKRRHPGGETYKSNKMLREDVSDLKKLKYNYQDISNFYSSILRNDSITSSLMSRLSEVVATDRKEKVNSSKNNDSFSHWDGSMTATEAEFNGLLAARIQGMSLDSFLRSVVEHIARDGTTSTMPPSDKRSKSSSSDSSSSSSSPPFDDKFSTKSRPNLAHSLTSPVIPERPSHSPLQSFPKEDSTQKSVSSQNSSTFSRTSNTPSGTRSKAVVISHCLSSDVKRNGDSDEETRKPVPDTLILVNPIITVMSKDSSQVSSPPTVSKKFGDPDAKPIEPQSESMPQKAENRCESPRFGVKKGSPSNGGSLSFPTTSTRSVDAKSANGKYFNQESSGQVKDNEPKKAKEEQLRCRNCSKSFVSKSQYRNHLDDCPESSWSSKITSSTNSSGQHKSLFTSASTAPTCSNLSKKTPQVEDSHANRFLKYYQLANELSGKSNC